MRVRRWRQFDVEGLVRGQGTLEHVGTGHAHRRTRHTRRRAGQHHSSGTRQTAQGRQPSGTRHGLVEALGVVFGRRVSVAHAAAAA